MGLQLYFEKKEVVFYSENDGLRFGSDCVRVRFKDLLSGRKLGSSRNCYKKPEWGLIKELRQ